MIDLDSKTNVPTQLTRQNDKFFFFSAFKKQGFEKCFSLKTRIWNKVFSWKMQFRTELRLRNHTWNGFFKQAVSFRMEWFCNVSEAELKFLQRARFCIIFYTRDRYSVKLFNMRQILNSIYLQPLRFGIKIFETCQFQTQCFRYALDFELNALQKVRFWICFFAFGQFLFLHHK